MQTVSPRAGKRIASRQDSFIQVRHVAVTAILSLSIVGLLAAPVPGNKPSAYPAWWFSRGVIVQTTPTNASPSWPTNYPTSDDYVAINEGQLKYLATQAYNELQSSAPTNVWGTPAGQALASTVTNWSPTTGDDYPAINLGQLKTVAKPFYDVLTQIGYSSGYPWSGSGADDYTVANIGQAKHAFSFDVGKGTAVDGVPDWWETHYFGAPGLASTNIVDGNGLTLGQDYNQGNDPTNYYSQNGQTLTPVLTIQSGNNQTGLASALLANALVVKVTNSSNSALANAPVTFTVLTGGGQLVTDPLSPDTATSLQMTTAPDGTATICYIQPAGVGISSTITAQTGGESVTFTATTQGFSPAIVGGSFQALALTDAGNLRSLTGSDPASTPVNGVSDVINMSVGMAHSVAVQSNGTVWAWGSNSNGQLGDGTTTDEANPVQTMASGPTPLTGIMAVAAGGAHTLALTQDGDVLAWGSNNYGQLGNGTTTDSASPVAVNGLPPIVAIAARQNYSVALDVNGNVWVWGSDSENEIGDASFNDAWTPVEVPGVSGITAIAAGEISVMALASDHTVWTWGDNFYGELGEGDETENDSPVHVPGLSGVTAISAGLISNYAVKSDGTVQAWGYNVDGELGNNSTTQADSPVAVSAFTDTGGTVAITSVATTDYAGLALGSDGTIWSWGGMVGAPNLLPALVPLRITTTTTDTNNNAIPDSWENTYLGGLVPDAYAPAYNPPYTIIQDYQLGLSPQYPILQGVDNPTATTVDGGTDVTWNVPPGDPLTNILVQEQDGSGNWNTVATLSPSATSYMDSSGLPLRVTTTDASGNQVQKTLTPPPPRYAVIDLGNKFPTKIANNGMMLYGDQRWNPATQTWDTLTVSPPATANPGPVYGGSLPTDMNREGEVVGYVNLDHGYTTNYPANGGSIAYTTNSETAGVAWPTNVTVTTAIHDGPAFWYTNFISSPTNQPPASEQYNAYVRVDNGGNTYGSEINNSVGTEPIMYGPFAFKTAANLFKNDSIEITDQTWTLSEDGTETKTGSSGGFLAVSTGNTLISKDQTSTDTQNYPRIFWNGVDQGASSNYFSTTANISTHALNDANWLVGLDFKKLVPVLIPNAGVKQYLDYFPTTINNRYTTDPVTGLPVQDYQILAQGSPGPGAAGTVLMESERNASNEPTGNYTNNVTALVDLLSSNDQQAWRDVAGVDMNDNGAIVGTATYSGTNTAIAQGSHGVLLYPMPLQSKDRMITGSIKLPDGWTGTSLHFINETTGQDLGTFSNIVENLNSATPAFKIYNTEEDMFSDSEMSQDQAGTLDSSVTDQKVTFYKDDNDPKLLHFATTFDDVGDVRVEIIKNGSVMGYNQIHLTADTDFSSLISEVDNRVSNPYPAPIVDPTDPNDPAGAGGNGGSSLLLAQEPGPMSNPGTIDSSPSDPTQLVLPLHTGTALPSGSDDDLSLITLRRPSGLTTNTGTITLTVGAPSSVALFNQAATHVLANYSVNLASPSGDLAALATGNAQVWIRGAAANTDLTLTYTYTDANGVVQNTNTLHLSVSTSSAMVWPGTVRNMPLFCDSGGIRGPPAMALSLMSMKVWSNVTQTAPIPPSKINNNALTTKSLIKVLEAILTGSPDPVSYYRGILEGFAGGAWGDLNTLAAFSTPGQIYYARDNFARAYNTYLMFNKLIKDTPAKRQQLLDNLLISAGIQAGSAYIQWQSMSSDQQEADVEYCRGYVTGYVIEQVLVLKGIGLAAEAAKTTITTYEAGSSAVTAADALRADITALSAAAENVTAADMPIAKDAIEKAMAEASGSSTVGGVITTKLAPLDSSSGQATLGTFTQELAIYTKGTQWSLQGKDAVIRLAQLLTTLGTQASAKSVESFGELYRYLIPSGEPDRFNDLLRPFLDSGGLPNQTVLKTNLEQWKTALDAGPPQPSLYFQGIEAVKPTLYRYAPNLNYISGGNLSVINPLGGYFSFDAYTTGADAQSFLQLPTGTYRYRLEVNTSNVTASLRIPYGFQDTGTFLEPVTRDYPSLGTGGGTQVKIQLDTIPVARILDMQTGQYITVP